jgi:dihydrolipoamide dehydrogenase
MQDIAIIGAGPGGYVAAIRAAQLGLSVTVIERDSRFGGTCTLRGCIPTKALLRDAHLFQEIKKAVQQGLFKTGELEIDFSKIQARKSDGRFEIVEGRGISVQEEQDRCNQGKRQAHCTGESSSS